MYARFTLALVFAGLLAAREPAFETAATAVFCVVGHTASHWNAETREQWLTERGFAAAEAQAIARKATLFRAIGEPELTVASTMDGLKSELSPEAWAKLQALIATVAGQLKQEPGGAWSFVTSAQPGMTVSATAIVIGHGGPPAETFASVRSPQGRAASATILSDDRISQVTVHLPLCGNTVCEDGTFQTAGGRGPARPPE